MITPNKNKETLDVEHGPIKAIHEQARASTGWARASTSKHEQISEFPDFGRFEPDITDFVINL